MKYLSSILLSSAIALSAPMGAMAQTNMASGTLDNVSGSVLIERNGEFFRTNSDSNVIVGDRIVAIDGASANITFGECETSVTDTRSVTITGAQACDEMFAVRALEVGDPARRVSIASLDLEGNSGVLLAVLAVGAVAGGVILLTDDDTPSSP